jgi:hypothetical protein
MWRQEVSSEGYASPPKRLLGWMEYFEHSWLFFEETLYKIKSFITPLIQGKCFAVLKQLNLVKDTYKNSKQRLGILIWKIFLAFWLLDNLNSFPQGAVSFPYQRCPSSLLNDSVWNFSSKQHSKAKENYFHLCTEPLFIS